MHTGSANISSTFFYKFCNERFRICRKSIYSVLVSASITKWLLRKCHSCDVSINRSHILTKEYMWNVEKFGDIEKKYIWIMWCYINNQSFLNIN